MITNKFILAVALLIPTIIFAQQNNVDSTESYEKKILKLYKDGLKNIEETLEFKETKSNLIAYNKRKNNYMGVGYYVNYNSVNPNSLNTSLASSGFTKFNDYFIGLGLLGNFKRDNVLVDFNLVNISFYASASASATNQKIRINSLDFIQTNIGYAIVNKPNFTLYPYAGLGLRVSTMTLENTQVINATGTNITNYVLSPKLVKANSFKVTYQAGLGMDLKLNPNSTKNLGTFLVIKGGVNNTIGAENFKIDNGFKFNPNLNIGAFQLNVGIKFVRYNTAVKPTFEN
jgi:hypothetical protein